ncbi:MAG: hypothetical protein U9N33_03415 [Campylobacterota bacterium]|nr:hypothetical protein [Campylobacterota bacterium]
MQILTSPLFEEQLKDILEILKEENYEKSKQFKIYLDTIIVNAPTKAKKYKQSIYFDDEKIKDIEFQGYTIPFLIDEAKDNYVILGITKKG